MTVAGADAARFSVVCAVWHRQSRKQQLVQDHFANLERLNRTVEAIYVLDENDTMTMPERARILRCSQPLTIYQAWAAGFAIVETPYGLNLNLDDRLFRDALDYLNAGFEQGLDAVGGDWMVRYDLDDASLPVQSLDLNAVPFLTPWPPARGSRTRLGSGDGRRRTLGPAVAYRMSALRQSGGIPTTFGDGSKITAIGDAVIWAHLERGGKKLGRAEKIIGAYYSEPAIQAEFRARDDGSTNSENRRYAAHGAW